MIKQEKLGFGSKSFRQYAEELEKIPVIPHADELKYLRAWKLEGDTKARNKVITGNLRYVVMVAKHYFERTPRIDLMDLIQAGNQGLFHAIEKWDVSLTYKFVTYAQWWIRAYMQRMVRFHNIPLGGLSSGSSLKPFDTLSLDAPMYDGEDGTKIDRDDVMEAANGRVPTPDEIFSGYTQPRMAAERFLQNTKNPMVRSILLHRIMADEPATLEDLGRVHGVSRERIRQVELQLKGRMKRMLLRENWRAEIEVAA